MVERDLVPCEAFDVLPFFDLAVLRVLIHMDAARQVVGRDRLLARCLGLMRVELETDD